MPLVVVEIVKDELIAQRIDTRVHYWDLIPASNFHFFQCVVVN